MLHNRLLLAIAILCTLVQSAWAQGTAMNEGALRDLVRINNHTAKLGNDLTLTEGRLDIVGTNITLDLNGHTLRRPMTAADDGGQVIMVRDGGKLTITDSGTGGQITGGWAYQGGAIYVSNGCELTISGGTITGNRADTKSGGYGFGGAIESHGTLTLTGGVISGNTAGQHGDGIYYAEGTLNIQGNPVVDDLYLKWNLFLTLTGPLTSGASIGLNAENTKQSHLTLNYPNYHAGTAPTTFFTSKNDAYALRPEGPNGEVVYGLKYIERAWDATEQKVTKTEKACSSYTVINGNDTSDSGWYGLYDGWYAVTENSAYKTLNVLGADVHLIIADGKSLTLTGGVKLLEGHKLRIYSHNAETGQLIVTNSYNGASGIGGDEDTPGGQLEVHGGIINATGGRFAAGIGGGEGHGFSLMAAKGGLTVYGGTVTAQGGQQAAGIGSGQNNSDMAGYVTIYGGTVTAIAGHNPTDDTDEWAAGIGGGSQGDGAIVHIYGGTVNATGRRLAAAIGGGDSGNGVQTYIHGGNVTAVGGIGGGDGAGASGKGNGGYIEIHGGTVNASKPGTATGAAIGCGYRGEFANIKISGGTVNAETNERTSAAIGGGGGYNPTLDITISGGTVTATSDYGAYGIGAGAPDPSNEYGYQGTLSITGGTLRVKGAKRAIGGENARDLMQLYDGAMVRYGESPDATSLSSTGGRQSACVNHKFAAIEPCTHPAATYTYSGTSVTDTHTMLCSTCNLTFAPEPHNFAADGKCTVCGAEATYAIGDINADGKVTIADVTALVNIILGKASDTPSAWNSRADVNADESVTIADVTELVNIILGKTAASSQIKRNTIHK